MKRNNTWHVVDILCVCPGIILQSIISWKKDHKVCQKEFLKQGLDWKQDSKALWPAVVDWQNNKHHCNQKFHKLLLKPNSPPDFSTLLTQHGRWLQIITSSFATPSAPQGAGELKLGHGSAVRFPSVSTDRKSSLRTQHHYSLLGPPAPFPLRVLLWWQAPTWRPNHQLLSRLSGVWFSS